MSCSRIHHLSFLPLLFVLFHCTCVRANCFPASPLISNPPTNDSLANATEVVLSDGTFSDVVEGNRTDAATSEDNEGICVYPRSWWYAFTPTVSAEYRINSEVENGGPPDDEQNQVSLGIYTGATHPLTELTCLNDDNAEGAGEVLNLPLTAGTTYYLRIAAPEDANLEDITTTVTELVYTWTGADDDEWNNAANWDLGAIPGETATARIPDEGFRLRLQEEQVLIGALLLEGGNVQIQDDAMLTVTGRNQGIVITNNSRLTVEGDLEVSPLFGPAIELNDGFIPIRETGTVVLQEMLYIIEGQVDLEGALRVSSNTGNGIEIVDGNLYCQEGGEVIVDQTLGNGIELGANGSVRIEGQFNVSNTSVNGISLLGGSNFSIQPTGILDVLNVGNNAIFIEDATAELANSGKISLNSVTNLLSSGDGFIFNTNNSILQAEGTFGSLVEFDEPC
ncbi:MAG: hypothetical protein AAGA62_02890, partial [Bacteroidota bacterium]